MDAVPDSPILDPDQPANRVVAAELAEIVGAAVAGLTPRDRLAIELADRQGLGTDELGEALGMPAPSAYKLLVRARVTARRSLGALVLARSGRRDCAQLDLILSDWDGRLTPLLRKRIARHVEECDTCAENERRLVSPAALLGGSPAMAVPVALRSNIHAAAEHARRVGPPAPADGWRDGWPPGSRSPGSWPAGGRRRVLGVAGAAALVLLAIVTITLVSRRHVPSLAGDAVAGAGATIASVPPASATTTDGPTTTATTRPGTSTRTSRPPTVPVSTIDSASAECVPVLGARGGRVPRLTWTTHHDTGVDLYVGTERYGSYPASGTVDLPGGGCDPAVAPPTYTITTTGGTGKPASRTLTLDQSVTTTTTATTTTAPPTSGPLSVH